MRRVLLIVCLTALVGGGAFAAMGQGGGESARTYKIVFDNAFGLVEGADFKVGGVAVGAIEKLDLQRSDMRALVTVSATTTDGFGGLRDDTKCVIAPQSLIGEYYVDCEPGTRGRVLESGATVPVRQTESPIPPDLVLNVMRLPIRERFRIILTQLGAGLAARGDDLNETIRRAIPAIGATNEVLDVLARNRQTLAALSRDSGQVMRVLGRRRDDLGDFVVSARALAETTAERRGQLAETFRRFPGFLQELTPTMVDLGTAARLQTPALRDLRLAAGDVRQLLGTLRPFSRALRPATVSLGETSRTGRTAARESASLLRNLAALGGVSREPAKNLAIVLSDLDDRSRAVEPDPDSPGGAGYTGLEAPLQYIFDQTLALNIFDQRGYSLKLNINPDECSEYTDAEHAREDLERYERCNQNLGPSQPGVTQPDPSPADPGGSTRRTASERSEDEPAGDDEDTDGGSGGGDAPAAGDGPAPGVLDEPVAPGLPPVQQLLDRLPELLDSAKGPLDKAKDLPKGLVDRKPGRRPGKGDGKGDGDGGGQGGGGGGAEVPVQDLLDFLLAP